LLKIAYHPIYKHPLPEGHRFPMEKYELLPRQLLHEGTCSEANFFEPDLPNDKYIVAVHEPEYFYDLLNIKLSPREARKIGFPLTEDLVERERLIADGTMKACEFALEHGIAMNIAGGTHHAYTDRGEAFCMLNDQAIGARYLQARNLAKKILIIDLDVHQGNGTAEIFQKDDSVFTFSMHGAANYPFKKEKSDWDIPLKKGTGDTEYLTVLGENLPKLIDRTRPDFIFFYAGWTSWKRTNWAHWRLVCKAANYGINWYWRPAVDGKFRYNVVWAAVIPQISKPLSKPMPTPSVWPKMSFSRWIPAPSF